MTEKLSNQAYQAIKNDIDKDGLKSNKKYKWNETKPNENEFYLIPNSAKINTAKYSQFESNYTPKPFSFKCFLPT